MSTLQTSLQYADILIYQHMVSCPAAKKEFLLLVTQAKCR